MIKSDLTALLQAALHLHRQDEFELAEKKYQHILKLDPNHSDALHGYAFLLVQMGKAQVAVSLLEAAIKKEPDNPVFYNSLGNVNMQLKAYGEAEKYYQKAIEKQPDYAEAYNNLGNAYVKQSKLKKAVTAYVKATHCQPDYVDAHYHLALALIKQAQTDAAITVLQTVLTLYPLHLLARLQLANLYLEREELDSAITQYLFILDKQPEHMYARINLGAAYLKNKEYEQALAQFNTAIQVDSRNIEARQNLAATFLNLDRFDQAIYHYLECLKQCEATPEINYNLGVALMHQGHLDKALTYFHAVLDTLTDHVDALANIAACLIKLNRRQEALDIYKKIQGINPNDDYVNFMLHALQQDALVKQAPQTYVTQLFDNYANHFDSHAKGGLQYRVPELIYERIKTQDGLSPPPWHLLDLGCGTGLAMQPFRDDHLVHHAVGVDLSPKMIMRAEQSHLYDACFTMDINAYLAQCELTFDGVIAADSLVYIGDLSPLFASIVQVMKPNAWFVFTTERAEPGCTQNQAVHEIDTLEKVGYRLTPFGRFAHSRTYLESVLTENQLQVISFSDVILRMHQDKPLMGYLVLAKFESPSQVC